MLTKPQVLDDVQQRQAICSKIYPIRVMNTEVGQLLPGMERHFTPVSDHLYALFHSPMREYKPAKDDYQRTFDRFEYLLGLVHADLVRREYDNNKLWGPVGCFGWRGRHIGRWEGGVHSELEEELDKQGQTWPPIAAGLFGGSLDRVKDVKKKFDTFVAQLPFY